MSIRSRRNSLLKSSISINSIKDSVTSFTKGLSKSRDIASNIIKQTRESNNFKRTLIGKDNEFFRKRRENVRRKQREDELESSTVSGVTKKQGNVVTRSTKGFLGRILDFFGIILIGWFVTNLPKILKSLSGLINIIRKTIGVLTGYIDGIKDFIVGFGRGIAEVFAKLPKVDLFALRAKNTEQLESADINLRRLNRDLIDIGKVGSTGGIAVGLATADGDYDIAELVDDDKKEEKDDTNQQMGRSAAKKRQDEVTDLDDESKAMQVRPTTTKLGGNADEEIIKGIGNEREINQIKSNQSREKGETIDSKNLENEQQEENKKDDNKFLSSIKNFSQSFFGNEARQQTDKLNVETEDKKDNSSNVNSGLSKIKNLITLSQEPEMEKKVTPRRRQRINMQKSRSNRNKIVIMEKAVAVNTPSMNVGNGGGSKGLNNLGEFNIDNEKRVVKKIQSVVLNT